MKDSKPNVWQLALVGIFSASTPGLANDKKAENNSSTSHHEHMMQAPEGMEKCVGIVRKGGQNNCATDVHACAGMIPKDAPTDELGYYRDEWRWVKKGSCKEIQAKIAARREKAAKSQNK